MQFSDRESRRYSGLRGRQSKSAPSFFLSLKFGKILIGVKEMLHSNSQATVTIDSLFYWVNKFCDEENLSESVKALLLEQVEGLGVLYGREVNKTEALQLLSRQIEITRTGMVREPVGIEEFIVSPEYMNQGDYVRPKILEHLKNLFDPEKYYYEVVLGGGIGIGKNYFADMAMSYDVYRLSCLYSPQSYYGLAPGSNIVFINQSKTKELARKVVFQQLAGRLAASGYFPRHFAWDDNYKAELKFPNDISILPVSGAETAAIGMNVFGAIIDEMNFMKQKKAKKLVEGEFQDTAEAIYFSILMRMESRFHNRGIVPGKIYLISSANHKGDFIDRKEKEAEANEHIYVMHMSQWEALPADRFCGVKFFVKLPSEWSAGGVYREKPEVHENEEVIEVPIEYVDKFETNMVLALRDIGGIAVEHKSKFLDKELILSSFKRYAEIYGEEQIFKHEILEFDTSVHRAVESYLNLDILRRLSTRGPFSIHIDLGISGDAAGVCVGHSIGSIDIGSRTIFNKKTGTFERKAQGSLPVIGLPGILKVVPPDEGEIELEYLRELISVVCDYLPVYWLTMDRHQSASFLQFFRSRGVKTFIISTDRSPDPYIETKHALKEERLYATSHIVFLEEMPVLDQDISTGKIDHPEGGSKDVSDAIASVVFNLMNQKISYRHQAAPKKLGTSIKGFEKRSRVRLIRPDSGRKPIYS